MTIKNALEQANKEFISIGIDNYFYEVRELLAFTLGKSKEWIMTNIEYEISQGEYDKFLELKEKRIKGIPFQYILGEQYFMGLKFLVNEDVLIPRADTEILVYKVIDILKNKKNSKILDMCTGSGCIAISLEKNLTGVEVVAADISEKALNIAKKNSEVNQSEIKFYNSNLFEKIPKEKFDIIVSNPPYIATKNIDNLAIDVLHEPKLALDGGDDGLKFYRKISESALDYLKDDGFLVFEIGYDQANDVREILDKLNYKEIEVIKDYSNNDRVLIARK